MQERCYVDLQDYGTVSRGQGPLMLILRSDHTFNHGPRMDGAR
jgi:hypothetical protein